MGIAVLPNGVLKGEVTVESDLAVHYGFKDEQQARRWEQTITRRMVNNRRKLVEIGVSRNIQIEIHREDS